jgi:hypothetical protein
MKISTTAIIMTLCLVWVVGLTVLPSEATTNFNGSTVVSVDHAQRSITFQTKEGQTWTLSVADPSVLKNEQIAKGDHVSLEIDPDDRVTKIIKISGVPSSTQTPSRDDAGDLRP